MSFEVGVGDRYITRPCPPDQIPTSREVDEAPSVRPRIDSNAGRSNRGHLGQNGRFVLPAIHVEVLTPGRLTAAVSVLTAANSPSTRGCEIRAA